MSSDKLGSLTRALVGVPIAMLGTLLDIANRLAGADGENFFQALKKFVSDWKPALAKAAEKAAEPIVYLRRLFEAELITVGATKGTESMIGLSASGEPTAAATVIVDEQITDGKLAQLFGSKGEMRRRWTRSQVAKFATEHPDRLRGEGYGNFF